MSSGIEATPPNSSGDQKKQTFDEALWDRQLYALGHDTMRKMLASSVLIVGLKGLGAEIAKDVILAGVKAVTLCDNEPVAIADLTTHFYLTQADVGKPRAAACVHKLAELNEYVPVHVHGGDIDAAFLGNFRVVIMVNQPLEFQLKVNKFCRSLGVAFISTDIFGVFSYIFCDFGDSFEVVDSNGEPPQSLVVTHVSQENPGVVTVADDTRIPFEDGEQVVFGEIQGMTELNDNVPKKIKVLGPYTFSLEGVDTTKFSPYKGGTSGYVKQVKVPQKISFASLEQSLAKPEFLISDFAKMERPPHLHLGLQALWQFHQKHKVLPEPHNAEHAKEVLAIAEELNSKQENKLEKLDDKLFTMLSYCARGEIPGLTATIGGIAAQEILKACSGKFMPIKQWFYFDCSEVLPSGDLPASEFQPLNSRYDGQIITLGRTLHKQITDLNLFLVGSGAIGCEVLKIWAMMGLGVSEKGMIHVTDMDVIEKSNLSRQFLFRTKDIEHLKSEVAAVAIKEMNPDVNIKAYSIRVGPETEDVFNPSFYESLDAVCNALDNIEARLYMDSQCVMYKKPLFESGTLGTKGNTQVVVPHLTESYASSRDPPEKGIPLCTLHHFPNAIEHTVQWARDIFEGLFKNQAETVNSYLTNPNFKESLKAQSSATAVKVETLNTIKSCLIDERPNSFEDCITWARVKFQEYFCNNVKQLLYNFPADAVTNTGVPFWSGPKRAPTPLEFSLTDPLHMDFIIAAANLRAENFGIPGTRDKQVFLNHLPKVMAPDFVPKEVKINTDPNADNKQPQTDDPSLDDDVVEKLLDALPPSSQFGKFQMNAIEFEKDVDTNFHIDFITATANLRATNYKIPLGDRHKCKGIAGKIIPAMITTTAVVSGLVCVEMLKVIQKKPLEDLKNGFVNLALPFTAFSEPLKPMTTKVREGFEWTLWDRFDVQGDITIQQFLNYFKEKYQLDVSMISCGVSQVFNTFMAKEKRAERLPKKVTEVVELVTKQKIPENLAYLRLEIVASRVEDDEDVDVPSVIYHLKPMKEKK